jgi:ATP-binding cassette subfamily B (MDR/TAP) protein 1
MKTHCRGAAALAGFFTTIFLTYSFAFYMGSVWIKNDIYNDFYKREYRAGEIISCFFGVIFGMFSLGMATPNIKAVLEGRAAGKMAFDIIDRNPTIDQDDPKGTKLDTVQGLIEFKNVDFFYPSRAE